MNALEALIHVDLTLFLHVILPAQLVIVSAMVAKMWWVKRWG